MHWKDMNKRKNQILKVIIEDYIDTAQPIGSRTISKKPSVELSSATIRNEMADLEMLGYLVQPHTSAGRIPTEQGYRYYVDTLIHMYEAEIEQLRRFKQNLGDHVNEMNQLVKKASDILSKATGYISITTTPDAARIQLKAVQIVPLSEHEALIVAVGDKGVLKNATVKLQSPTNPELLIKMSNVFNEKLSGHSLNTISLPILQEIQKNTGASKEIIVPIIEGVARCLEKIHESEIYTKGTSNIFNYPEFNDILKAQELLKLLQNEEVMTSILSTAYDKKRVSIKIGHENDHEEIQNCSIITATYGVDGNEYGTIGVIGPTRMDYTRVIGAIKCIKSLINKELIELFNR